MATIVLDVQDESLLTQIKKACQLFKGVASKHGRVTEYASLKDFYKEMGL